jgi:hypothetical protein
LKSVEAAESKLLRPKMRRRADNKQMLALPAAERRTVRQSA